MNITDKNKKIIKLLIRISITTALLVWVFSQIDLQQFWQLIKTARWQSLIAVWGLTVMLFWIRSIRMQFILKKQGCSVSIATIFGASAVTCLYGMVVPGILSTGAKWYILRRNTGKGSSVLSSMLYNQSVIMVVMITFGLVAIIVTNPSAIVLTDTRNRWLLPILCGILLAAIILISLLLLNSRTGSKIIKALMVLLRILPAEIRQKGQEALEQIAIFKAAGARFHLTVAILVIITGIGGGAVKYILAARGANIVTVPVAVFVWVWAIIFILGRIPISVANLGVREVTLVGLLSIYGVEKSQALLMSMILFSASVVMAAIGAMYQLFWTITAKKSAHLSSKPAP